MHAVPTGGPLCKFCSSRHQRPVRHGVNNCPEANAGEFESGLKNELMANIEPSPARLTTTVVRNLTEFKKPRGMYANMYTFECIIDCCLSIGEFPCRVLCGGIACDFHSFKTYHTANSHMKKKHKLTEGDTLLYPKPTKGTNTNLDNHFPTLTLTPTTQIIYTMFCNRKEEGSKESEKRYLLLASYFLLPTLTLTPHKLYPRCFVTEKKKGAKIPKKGICTTSCFLLLASCVTDVLYRNRKSGKREKRGGGRGGRYTITVAHTKTTTILPTTYSVIITHPDTGTNRHEF